MTHGGRRAGAGSPRKPRPVPDITEPDLSPVDYLMRTMNDNKPLQAGVTGQRLRSCGTSRLPRRNWRRSPPARLLVNGEICCSPARPQSGRRWGGRLN